MDKIKAFFSRIGMDENTIIHLNPVFLGRVSTMFMMNSWNQMLSKGNESFTRIPFFWVAFRRRALRLLRMRTWIFFWESLCRLTRMRFLKRL